MSGTFAAGIGPTFGAVGANGLLGEFGRAAAHATANLILGSFSGKNPTLGNFATGFFSSLTGSMAHQLPIGAQIGISSLTGGIIADLGGDEFWKGAATGAIVSTVNHGAHGIQEKIGEHKFFKRLRLHYENNNGQDFFITTDEFKYLIKHGNVNYSTAKQIGDGYFSAEIDFYKSKLDLALSFGRARIYYKINDNKYIYSNFYDRYDFDPKPWGNGRSYLNEIITRSYNWYSNGAPFDIYYRK